MNVDGTEYVTRVEMQELVQTLLVRGDGQTIEVDNTPGGQIVRSTHVVMPEATSGLAAYYFSCAKQSDTTIRVSSLRFRVGKSMYIASNIGASGLNDYVDVSIPTTDGTYWVHFQALYTSSYAFTIQAGTVDTHPDQTAIAPERAYREELCEVVVASNVITTVTQIWPGHILSVNGVVP